MISLLGSVIFGGFICSFFYSTDLSFFDSKFFVHRLPCGEMKRGRNIILALSSRLMVVA